MITIVICTLDFYKALDCIRYHNYLDEYKCIIVTPDSNDIIKDMYENKNLLVLKDKGEGLGQARNIALNQVDTAYTMFMSDDNIIYKFRIKEQLHYMTLNDIAYCGFLTRMKDPKGYLNKCLDIRWRYRFTESLRQVVGMPSIMLTSVVNEIQFPDGFCDDTGLCEQLNFKGHKVGYSDIEVYERSFTYKELKARFKMYKKGDLQYYNTHKHNYNIWQKIKSRLGAIKREWIPNIYYLPFYLMIIKWRVL